MSRQGRGAEEAARPKATKPRKRVRRSKGAAPTCHGEVPFGPDLAVLDYRFENGLRLLVLEDRSAPVVSFQSWFRVGSRDEQPGKTGIAHFLEHLMFKGTHTRAVGEFDKLMELGGAEVNAATWTDWTSYYENAPKETFPLAVELEADRLSNLQLDEAEVAAERDVVMNERRWSVDGDVDGKGSEMLYLAAYKEHPYGWPTIGFMRDIRGLTLSDCKSFYDTHYAPNHMTLVAVGHLNVNDTVALVDQHYGAKPATRRRRARLRPEPMQTRARRKRVFLETDTEKVLLGYPGVSYGSRDYAVMQVVKEILVGGRSARLCWRLVHADEKATQVSLDMTPFEHPGLVEVALEGREGVTGDTLMALYDQELRAFLKAGPTEQELETAKNRLELSILTGLETASGKADQIGFDTTVAGKADSTFRTLDVIRRATGQRVREVASKYLSSKRQTRIDVLPKAKR